MLISFSYVGNMINNSSLSESFSRLIMMSNYTGGDINCSNVVLFIFVEI